MPITKVREKKRHSNYLVGWRKRAGSNLVILLTSSSYIMGKPLLLFAGRKEKAGFCPTRFALEIRKNFEVVRQ